MPWLFKDSPPQKPAKKSWLDKSFGLFTEVHAGEALGAVVLLANIFLLLTGYYLLKTVREALILAEGGAEVKSYSAAGQALLLLFVVPAFGMLAARMERVRLLARVTLFFIANLCIFYWFGMLGFREGVAFYLWVGVFNVFIVAQFWGFANDLYTEEQGKRLFPAIGIGSTLGALAGGKMAQLLFARLGPYNLMLIAAVFLGASIGATMLANQIRVHASVEQQQLAAKPLGLDSALKLIRSSRFLMAVALLIFFLNVVNTSGEFVLGKLVVNEATKAIGGGEEFEAARKTFIGEFYGDFFAWVSIVGLLIQTFIASRTIKYLGVGGALFILPMISLTGYTLMLLVPVLAIVKMVKVLENATDYSLQNTLRHALFLPTTRECKYKAKAAIDTFVVRAGDMFQGGLVYAATAVGLSLHGFIVMTILFVLAWLGAVYAAFSEHRKLSGQAKQFSAAVAR
jgi:ATP:ADP antiporter, AAA family